MIPVRENSEVVIIYPEYVYIYIGLYMYIVSRRMSKNKKNNPSRSSRHVHVDATTGYSRGFYFITSLKMCPVLGAVTISQHFQATARLKLGDLVSFG